MFSVKKNVSLLSLVFLALVAFRSVKPANAFTSPSDMPIGRSSTGHQDGAGVRRSSLTLDQLKKQWIDRSVEYYSKVMREERRRNMGQIADDEFVLSEEYQRLAKQHYFALTKIRDGQHRHAEIIYRRIIDQIMSEEEDGHCDHAKLAATTLLLALHCQRMGDMKKTRSVFLSFFRIVVMDMEDEEMQCACTAKVLGAYALFEMRRGNVIKSLEIARKAVEFDEAMEPVLNWKQFREAQARTLQ